MPKKKKEENQNPETEAKATKAKAPKKAKAESQVETATAVAVETKPEIKISRSQVGFIRETARKVRRTVNLVRNMSAGQAVTQLKFMPYKAASTVRKAIESAMANASHNLQVENPDELKISQILVDDATMYKRWRAANKGRAHSIKKRNSQLRVVLSELGQADYAKYVWQVSKRNKKNQKKG